MASYMKLEQAILPYSQRGGVLARHLHCVIEHSKAVWSVQSTQPASSFTGSRNCKKCKPTKISSSSLHISGQGLSWCERLIANHLICEGAHRVSEGPSNPKQGDIKIAWLQTKSIYWYIGMRRQGLISKGKTIETQNLVIAILCTGYLV